MKKYLLFTMGALTTFTIASDAYACEVTTHNTATHNLEHTQVVEHENLKISGAYGFATLPGAPVGGGYVTIENLGEEADKLLSLSSPDVPEVLLHSMEMVDGVMKMSTLEDGIEIPAGKVVSLEPGGNHIMFMKLTQALEAGQVLNVVLKFEKAGEVTIPFTIIARTEENTHEHGSE